MTAYRIDREDIESKMSLGYRYSLPRLECRVCTPDFRGWGDYFEYPALNFQFLNEREFSFDRFVTMGEMSKIRRRFETAAGRKLNLVPGGDIGEMCGRAYTKELVDFEWGRTTVPQISRQALEKLTTEGIELVTAEFRVFIPGRRYNTHLAIQVEPVAMMTEQSLRKH